MNQFVFKSRWIALGFAAVTLLSVYLVVGEEGDETVLTRVQGGLVDQKGELDTAVADLESKPQQPQIADYVAEGESEGGFTPDEDLIDDAMGLDATGFDTQPDMSFDSFDSGDFENSLDAEETSSSRPVRGESAAPPPPPRPVAGNAAVPQFVNGIPVRIAQPDGNN